MGSPRNGHTSELASKALAVCGPLGAYSLIGQGDQATGLRIDRLSLLPGVSEAFNAGSGIIQQARLRLRGAGEITAPYAQHWLIHVCIRKRAEMLASMRLRLWADRSDNATKIEVHPLIDLLARPNPLMSERQIVKATEMYRLLDGDAFWVKLDVDHQPMVSETALPAILMPVRGAEMVGEIDYKTGLVRVWRYTGNASREYLPHQVVHLREFNPANPLRGLSLAGVALRQADQDYQMDRLTDAMVQSGGQPSATFKSIHEITAAQARDASDAIRERTNQASPLVLPHGFEPVNASHSAVEMQFMEGRVWNRDAIMAVMGMTKPSLGITDDVNRANAKEARAVVMEETIIPAALDLEDQIQEQLVRPLADGNRFAIGFDPSGVAALEEDRDAKVLRAKVWFDMGVTAKAAARIEGLDDVEIGDDDLKPEPPPMPAFGLPPGAKPPAERQSLSMSERRGAAWIEHVTVMAAQEQSLRTDAQAIQSGYVRATIARLAELASGNLSLALKDVDTLAVADALAALLPNPLSEEFAGAMRRTLEQNLAAVFDVQARTMARRLGQVVAKFTRSEATAAAFLSTKQVQVAEGTMSTLAQFVRQHIADTLTTQGYTTQSIAQGIRETLADLEAAGELVVNQSIPARAQTIAITETNQVANFARVGELAANGIERMEWVSARDGNVRPSHTSVDGQERDTGQPFSNGLRWPGDENAPAAEVVNCRCTILAAIEEVT